MGQFTDKITLITGAASGIGRALGTELAARGAVVGLTDIDEAGAQKAAQEIEASGGRAWASGVDVTDAQAVRSVVEATVERHGRLDFLFNNAGIAITGEADEYSLADWRRTLEINLWGVIHGVHAAYPVMKKQGGGHLVNTASVAGLIPAPNEIDYVAAKHAVVGLSNVLRAEGRAFGVRVSVVCPGFIDTPILFEHSTRLNTGKIQVTSRQDIKNLIPFKVMPVERAARKIVDGVARNRGIIVITMHAKILWALYRLSPSLAMRLAAWSLERFRKQKAGG